MCRKTQCVPAIVIVVNVLKKLFLAAGEFVVATKRRMFIVAAAVKDIFAIAATVCACFSASFIATRMNRWTKEKKGWKKRKKMRRRIKKKKMKKKNF